ncbi:unnamed protein product, partial [Closterium sp. Naga37s-1]
SQNRAPVSSPIRTCHPNPFTHSPFTFLSFLAQTHPGRHAHSPNSLDVIPSLVTHIPPSPPSFSSFTLPRHPPRSPQLPPSIFQFTPLVLRTSFHRLILPISFNDTYLLPLPPAFPHIPLSLRYVTPYTTPLTALHFPTHRPPSQQSAKLSRSTFPPLHLSFLPHLHLSCRTPLHLCTLPPLIFPPFPRCISPPIPLCLSPPFPPLIVPSRPPLTTLPTSSLSRYSPPSLHLLSYLVSLVVPSRPVMGRFETHFLILMLCAAMFTAASASLLESFLPRDNGGIIPLASTAHAVTPQQLQKKYFGAAALFTATTASLLGSFPPRDDGGSVPLASFPTKYVAKLRPTKLGKSIVGDKGARGKFIIKGYRSGADSYVKILGANSTEFLPCEWYCLYRPP